MNIWYEWLSTANSRWAILRFDTFPRINSIPNSFPHGEASQVSAIFITHLTDHRFWRPSRNIVDQRTIQKDASNFRIPNEKLTMALQPEESLKEGEPIIERHWTTGGVKTLSHIREIAKHDLGQVHEVRFSPVDSADSCADVGRSNRQGMLSPLLLLTARGLQGNSSDRSEISRRRTCKMNCVPSKNYAKITLTLIWCLCLATDNSSTQNLSCPGSILTWNFATSISMLPFKIGNCCRKPGLILHLVTPHTRW